LEDILKLGVSFGAGGARGWAHVGALKAIEESGIRIDLVNGVSIGAIVGAAYSLYLNTDKMTKLATKAVHSVRVISFNIFRYSKDGSSFLSNMLANAICDISALRSSLLTHKNNIKALKMLFEDLGFSHTKIPFFSVATDLRSRKLISIKTGRLVDGLLPSISLPGIFPPVERDDFLLVDGGVLANVPVRELRRCGAEFVIAIRLVDRYKRTLTNGFELLCHVDSLKFNRINKRELESADFVIDIDTTELNGGKFEDYQQAIATGYHHAGRYVPLLAEKIKDVRK
jgi:NTE family protein